MTLLLADAAQVFETIGYVLVAILTLMVMIIVHEAGHYTVGKLLKFKINEFAIGMGPAIFKHKKKNGEIFSIRPIPIGGFCAFEGEDSESEEQGAFTSQKPWKRILVLLAGVTFNFVSAFLILTIAFCSYGYTLPMVAGFNEPVDSSITHTLEEGDIIYKINGTLVYTLNDFNIASVLSKTDAETVEVVVVRGWEAVDGPKDSSILRRGEKVTIEVPVTEFYSEDAEGNMVTYRGLGIATRGCAYRLNFFAAFWRSIVFCAQIVVFLFQTIGGLFTGLVSLKGSIGGPITTIGVITNSVANNGFKGVLMLLGMMSANIAIMNVLPLPALDGSRVIFTIIEWIRGKPINRKVEAIIHTVGIILLFAITIIFDILNFGTIASLF
ncbi:MAG: site-2 protease family protein [Clostridia bacterium]|nr:site-2 protease family protein [Clostridia bacterium]